MNALSIGWAQADITPDHPVFLIGQIYQRISKYVHGRLTATALALESGGVQAIFLSMDLLCPPFESITAQVRANLAADGIRPDTLIISATHTHNAYLPDDILWHDTAMPDPSIFPTLISPPDLLSEKEIEAFLVHHMTEVARAAWQGRAPGGIGAATEYAAVGFNRRPVFARDGQQRVCMYGNCADEAFVRYEGSADASVDMLYTWDGNGRLTGVAVCVPCPAQVYELHDMITPDYWGPVRAALRERLGDIHVLPLCGASGDLNPLDLTRISKTNGDALLRWGAQAGEVHRNLDMTEICQGIADRVTDAVARGLRHARNRIETMPVFMHEAVRLPLPMLTVSEEAYARASEALQALTRRFGPENPMQWMDLVRAYEPIGVVRRWQAQQRGDVVLTPVHILRIGPCAVATNPFELFVDYGLRIRARVRSPQTMVVQLTDAYFQYLPTACAIHGGSYSSGIASTLCGPPGGDLLVEETVNRIDRMWQRGRS